MARLKNLGGKFEIAAQLGKELVRMARRAIG
jgi:hypothetical protein